MKKRITAVALSLLLVMQMIFSTGMHQKIVKASENEDANRGIGIVLESCALEFPDGITKDNIIGGTTFYVKLKLKNETDHDINLRDKSFYILWNYVTEGENPEEHTLTSKKAEFKNAADDSYDTYLSFEPNTSCEVKVTVTANRYWKNGKATLQELHFTNMQGSTSEIGYGYSMKNGELTQRINSRYIWSNVKDYQQEIDFDAKESDIKDHKKPTITNIKKMMETPIYSSGTVEYDVGYKDDLSGVKKVELTFINGTNEYHLSGKVDEEDLCTGTVRVKQEDSEEKLATGTYTLSEAKVIDYSDKKTIYTLNKEQTKLIGDNEEADEIDVETFQVNYIEKGIVITKMEFKNADPKKEVQEYTIKDRGILELTLKNTTDEPITIQSGSIQMSKVYALDDQRVTLKADEERTFEMFTSNNKEDEGKT